MTKKKYPADTLEMTKFSQQAKSCLCTEQNHNASSSITVVQFFQTMYTSVVQCIHAIDLGADHLTFEGGYG